MRVPAEDVAAMTNPPVARPEMTPPPTAPDQIAMMKIATYIMAASAASMPSQVSPSVLTWTEEWARDLLKCV